MSQKADGTVVVGLKKAWSDGTTSIELSPADPQRSEGGRQPPAARSRGWTVRLVEKLAALVPPPFVNTIVYRGVLAGHAAWRREVVPKPPEERSRAVLRPERTLSPMPKIRGGGGSWVPRSDLLERVFHVNGFQCPTCGEPMTVRCVVQGRAATKVVEGLVKATGPP